MFPEARSVGQWLRHGWFVAVAYVVGFFFMLAVLGWHPHEKHKDDLPAPNPSIGAAFAEMWPALKRQLTYEDYFLKRDLPASAKPYREDFHHYVPGMTPPKAAE